MRVDGPGELGNLRKALDHHDSQRTYRKDAPKHEAASPAEASDQVDLSAQARLRGRLDRVPEVREDKLQEIRERMAQGEYPTTDRLKDAVRRMLGEL